MEQKILNLLKTEEKIRWSEYEEKRRYGNENTKSYSYGSYIAAREIREAVEKLCRCV